MIRDRSTIRITRFFHNTYTELNIEKIDDFYAFDKILKKSDFISIRNIPTTFLYSDLIDFKDNLKKVL